MKRDSSANRPHPLKRSTVLDARAATRLRVLNSIRTSGTASRTDISAALRLSPATVTFVTSSLMAGGLIEEVTATDAPDAVKRGRPRVALRLTKGDFHIAGIKIGRDAMSILVLDFDGTEVTRFEAPLGQPQMEPEALVLAIRDALAAVYAEIGSTVENLAGITIGLAGQIQAESRFVHWSSSLTRRNVDMATLFVKHLPCPAFVDNDANLVAKAEHLFGDAKGLRNFLVVTVEHGVGLGIVLDGQLYRGERGCGAEFGHIKVALNGAPCQCGQRGCLEAYVGSYGLLRRAAEVSAPGTFPTVRALVQNAAEGNAKAAKLIEEAGQMFGLGLSNLINLFDPERIILAGAQHRIAHLHTTSVLEDVRNNVVMVDAPLPDIHINHWDNFMWARGAAAMGIEHVSVLKVKELSE